ncbi:MAG: hypothetical protein EOP51_06780 [Sphingobacteriales bacterium]|nr:MAG: hypothetical protein EOP51_06780 [Sphingobacteriales bacterium]
MKFKTLLFLLLLCTFFTAQAATDTVYFNKAWNPCDRDTATYYRLVLQRPFSNDYEVRDYFLKSNQLQMVGNYKDSPATIKHGAFAYYLENGQKNEQAFFADNKLHGWYRYYYDSGFLSYEGKYVSGKAEGIWKYYYRNSDSVRFIRNYRHGYFSGEQTEKYRNGNVKTFNVYSKRGAYWFRGNSFTEDGNDTSYLADRSWVIFTNGHAAVVPRSSENLGKFLRKNELYRSLRKGRKGKVKTEILFDETGRIKEIKVLQGVSSEVDGQVVKILKQMPPWAPAIDEDGRPVSDRHWVDISF